jgi:hypothetical protein
VDVDREPGRDGLSSEQAYDAMFLFLLEFWRRGAPPSDDPVEWLLVAMDRSVSGDGGSNDPAMDEDWRRSVRQIVEGFDPYRSAFEGPEPRRSPPAGS